jgi:putative ATP-binding cassette transporter
MQQMWRVEGAASALFFIAIALMLAGKPWLQSSNVIIGAAVIILLYIKSPFEQLAGAFAVADQARISLRRLAELADSFSTPEPDILLSGMPNPRPCVLQCLELRALSWHYADQHRFSLGPLNLKLHPGQITFVTGDNGSGKTTLIKILLGLYEPQNGTVLLNGKPVERAQRDDYRQLFSTVFTDYYLFEEISQDVSPEQLMPLLEKLQLNHKVTFEDQRFTTTDLSTGQRKRLALLHAWLDDRPAIIFDEWAADQDPEFRQRFYQQFLPELKAKNKLVVVISHDDRYFSMADQLITLRNGQLVSNQ